MFSGSISYLQLTFITWYFEVIGLLKADKLYLYLVLVVNSHFFAPERFPGPPKIP